MRAAAGGAALAKQYGMMGVPAIAAVEGGGWLIVNRLMNPKSGLFRLFAEGPGTAAVPVGVMAGQTGRAITDKVLHR